MNNEAIGVLGSTSPYQRSVMDQRMASQFNPQVNREPYRPLPNDAVGVTGNTSPYQRSVMDQRMSMEFNPQAREGFQHRSVMDRMMQKKFNMIHGDSLEAFRHCPCGCMKGQNCNCSNCPFKHCPCGCMKGQNCNCSNCPFKEGFQPRRSLTFDNPYNPYSYYVEYQPMN